MTGAQSHVCYQYVYMVGYALRYFAELHDFSPLKPTEINATHAVDQR